MLLHVNKAQSMIGYIPSLPGTAEENAKAHFVAEAVPLGTTPLQNVPALR